MSAVKRGALLPENAVGGGSVPDGEYTIKEITAGMFDYGGNAEAVPAITVLYHADDGADFEQSYSAGKGAKLLQPEDGKRFEIIGKNSNAFSWIGSILKAGFPKDKVDDDVSVFKGTRVLVTNEAQPKRPGIKDQIEGKTIPLVTKVLALPGTKATSTRPQSAPATARTPAAPSTAGGSNGADLSAAAIELIQTILATAPENTMTRVKLSTQVMLAATKDPALKSSMTALKKFAGDSSWLIENADAGAWSTDGEVVVLGEIEEKGVSA